MSRIPCTRCAKKFRTESGLRWHLVHIHECRDVEELLFEPAPSTLAMVAIEREIMLAARAKTLGWSVPALKELIGKHFPAYASGRPPQGTAQDRPTLNTNEVQKPPWLNPINMGEYWRNHRLGPPSL